MKPAIVLSTHTMGLAVIRSLGIMGVPVVAVYYDSNDMGYVSKYVRETIRAPHPEKSEEEFVDLLLSIVDRCDRGLLIPADDGTLVTVSRHKTELERHFTVACTDWSTTEKFIDKQHTYALAESIGVSAPKTIVPHSIEDVANYRHRIQYPCLAKPSQSHRYYEHFKTKMVRVDDFGQMLLAYQQAASVGLELMFQELIPGDDSSCANYNSYFWNGEPLVEFTAQQLRKAPPEYGSPRVAVSKRIPEVIEPGRRILQAMGFCGYSCTEFKRDARDGVYKLMEVNGRHNRSALLAVRCGVNFPWLQYKHLIQGELPSAHTYRVGVYWVDIARDVAHSARYGVRERYSLLQYIRPYLGPSVFSTFALKDPKPFVKRCANLVVRAIRPPSRLSLVSEDRGRMMMERAIQLEEKRLQNVDRIENYPDFHERHRVFPAIFEDRRHKRMLDVAAGVGCAAQRIMEHYPADILCNDITPKCLRILEQLGLPTTSFDLDNEQAYPFPDGHFDAVISLSTIEHLMHVDHFVKEVHRILSSDGYLYISSPNYASLPFFKRFVLEGRTFHDPISKSSRQRYEFYAHVRYFTYRTLLEFVSSFGFTPDTVYLPLPAGSSRYQALYARSRLKALAFRSAMWLMYNLLSPRWASEPILCFQKSSRRVHRRPRKVVL